MKRYKFKKGDLVFLNTEKYISDACKETKQYMCLAEIQEDKPQFYDVYWWKVKLFNGDDTVFIESEQRIKKINWFMKKLLQTNKYMKIKKEV